MFQTSIIITALLTFATAIPFPELVSRGALVGEDLPWQIYNLSIVALPSNTTRKNDTQHISFIAIDENENLAFITACERSAPAGATLYSNGYNSCEFRDAGFSLRSNGQLYFRRRFSSGQPFPFNVTTCVGIGDLTKAKYYSNTAQGMTVYEDHMEIACTLMNGR